MQVIVSHATSLTDLRLWKLLITEDTLCEFEELVCVLPPTLEYLHLGMSKYTWDYIVRPSHRLRLFSAIAQIQNLKKLHMHQWTAAVGSWIRDVDECTAPLLSLPDRGSFYQPRSS